jgi:hypothetical protein
MKGFIPECDNRMAAGEDRSFLQLYGGACIFIGQDRPVTPETLTLSC